MNLFFHNVKSWADERGLILNGDKNRQMLKLAEEHGELAGALARNNKREAIDAIGDMVVVLTILAEQIGVPIEDCMQAAWQEIKDRKGKTVNGIFIKENDKNDL